MCQKHHLCHIWGNTVAMAFFIAWHWSVTIPFGALWYIQRHQHSNSQKTVLVSSEDSSPHPKRIDWSWWLTPTKGIKGMSYLFVRYVVSNDTTSPKYCDAARLLASAQKRFLMWLSSSMSISKKKCLFNSLMWDKCFKMLGYPLLFLVHVFVEKCSF